MIEDKDIAPFEIYDAPSSSKYESDLPIAPRRNYFPIYHVVETFKPMSDSLYEERQILINFYSKHLQKIYGIRWSRRVIIKVKGFKSRSFRGASYYSYNLQRTNKVEYYLTKVDLPIENPIGLFYIAKELN